MSAATSDVSVDLLEGLEGPEAFTFASRRSFRIAGWSLRFWVPLVYVVALLFACFVWPLIYPVPSPTGANVVNANLPAFTPGHILGTDNLGNDIMSRIFYGGRVSLEVGISANVIGCVIGGVIGSLAGFRRGVVDVVIMRVLEIFLAFPSLVLLLIVSEYLGPSELHVVWAISFFTIPSFARLSRAYTIRLREEVFITASGLIGVGLRRMLFRHIAPNIAPQLLTFGVLGIGGVIIFEAALSFLGLGVPPPGPSWGNMISAAEVLVTEYPAQVIIPSAFLCATILSFNTLGDELRSRWNIS